MNDNYNNTKEMEITATAEAEAELVEADAPETNAAAETDTAAETEAAPITDEETPPCADDASDKKSKSEKKIRNKTKAAKVLGLIATVVSVVRAVLSPILTSAAVVIDLLVFFFLMMGGALMLAMSTIVLPFLPIILIVLGIALAVAVIAIELSPIIMSIISFVLARSAQKSARANAIDDYDCEKKISGAKRVSVLGLILSILSEPLSAIPLLVLSAPAVLIIIIAVVFILQLFGIAIG
jgi:hypothetical protein